MTRKRKKPFSTESKKEKKTWEKTWEKKKEEEEQEVEDEELSRSNSRAGDERSVAAQRAEFVSRQDQKFVCGSNKCHHGIA